MINGMSRSSSKKSSKSTMDEESIFSQRSSVSLSSTPTSLASSLSLNKRSQQSNDLPHYSESQESLPNYVPSMELFGLALVKTEFLTPYKLNPRRSWQPMLIEQNSNQLILYKINLPTALKNIITSLFKYCNKVDLENGLKDKIENMKMSRDLSNLKKVYDEIKDNQLLFEPISKRATFNKLLTKYKGEIHQLYTLNRMKIGKAPVMDESNNTLTNVKYQNILRLRVELNQLCIQFWSFNAMVEWYWHLNVGKDLCGEFDEMPKLKSIPRNLQHVLNTETNGKTVDSKLIIGDSEFFIKVNNDRLFIDGCLPELNSYDKWSHTIVSNYRNLPLNEIDDNLFVNFNKVSHILNTTGGSCRYFAIQQEGLVSVSECNV